MTTTGFTPDIADIIRRIGPGKLYSSHIQEVVDAYEAQRAAAGWVSVRREMLEIITPLAGGRSDLVEEERNAISEAHRVLASTKSGKDRRV